MEISFFFQKENEKIPAKAKGIHGQLVQKEHAASYLDANSPCYGFSVKGHICLNVSAS